MLKCRKLEEETPRLSSEHETIFQISCNYNQFVFCITNCIQNKLYNKISFILNKLNKLYLCLIFRELLVKFDYYSFYS